MSKGPRLRLGGREGEGAPVGGTWRGTAHCRPSRARPIGRGGARTVVGDSNDSRSPPPRSRSRRSRVKCLPMQEHRPETPVPVPFRVTGLAWPDSEPPNPRLSIHPYWRFAPTRHARYDARVCARDPRTGSSVVWFVTVSRQFRACSSNVRYEGLIIIGSKRHVYFFEEEDWDFRSDPKEDPWPLWTWVLCFSWFFSSWTCATIHKIRSIEEERERSFRGEELARMKGFARTYGVRVVGVVFAM